MSNKALYTQFLDQVLPGMPGLGEALAINAIRNAVIEFCLRSWVLNERIDPISLKAGQYEYDLDPPANELVVHQILILYVDGKPIEAGRADGSLDSTTVYGSTPRRYYQEKPQKVCFFPVPDTDMPNLITARVAFKPTRDSQGVESYVYENYLTQIAAGAKAELMLMPNVPFSNPQLGEYNRQIFNSACAAVKLQVQRQFVRAPMRVTSHHF